MKNDYEIRGPVTAIFLRKKSGEIVETTIDTEDFDLVNSSTDRAWVLCWNSGSKSFYVRVSDWVNSKYTSLYLHRVIMHAPKGATVDHVDHATLNNQKYNLRLASVSENNQNYNTFKLKTISGYRGVAWHEKRKKWQVIITVNRKNHYFGLYDDIEIAKQVAFYARRALMPFSPEATNSDLQFIELDKREEP